MRKKAIFITGAVGEIGQALVRKLAEQHQDRLLTLDLLPIPEELVSMVTHIEGDILDVALLGRLISEYEFTIIYHMAALLSTRSEFTPEMAHRVNVQGTMRLLQVATEQSERLGHPVRFVFPSSVAAYGMPDLSSKEKIGRVREWEWNYPTTMYGCNKLYCELLGTYYSRYYQQLAEKKPDRIDFRCVRFPGLISAFTVPSGGTSDYAPEMLHASAKGESYQCFVRENTKIPFMAMPDGVNALLHIAKAEGEQLTRRVYNVTSFSKTAGEISELVKNAFPDAVIGFDIDHKRQRIVDSWPADLNDNAAREDWGWKPEYDFEQAFNEYLIPIIRKRYRGLR
jgi:nucleoside-diphosphate-sugar epimerase